MASSKQWLSRQNSDCYVKQAKFSGYRSRAAFKLIEIQQKDKIFAPGMQVVDLGAAPGGWSQVAKQYIKSGKLLAIDILPMQPISGIDIMQCDFTVESSVRQIMAKLNQVDFIMSDMAPNMSGISTVDQTRSINLAEIALEFAEHVLRLKGGLLIKLFQGEGFDIYLNNLKKRFVKVVIRKPKASRDTSREVYLLARGFKG